MTSLTSLPVELIARIGELTDPFSHFDLACTCHYIANALEDIFKRHRAAYKQPPCSDVQPLTIPQTLRSVIEDPFFAYHVRTIHIWCARWQWSEWKPVRLTTSEILMGTMYERAAHCAPYFQQDDIKFYLDTTGKYLRNFERCSQLWMQAREELLRGDDGLIKALLIILCPRLKSVYYTLSSYVSCDFETGSVGNSSLVWLSRIMLSHRGLEREKWPPGLRSLRHLALGVEAGNEPSSVRNQLYPPLFVAQIFNLPNLKSLYLAGMSSEERWNFWERYDGYPLTSGCSPLQHLYVKNLRKFERETWEVFLDACRELTSVAFHGDCPDDVKGFIDMAQQTAPKLRSLMFYSLPGSRIEGYPRRHPGFYPPAETLHSEGQLRMVTVVASDIVKEAGQTYNGAGKITREEFTKYLVEGWEGVQPLPKSLEVLVLIGGVKHFRKLLGQYKDVTVEEMVDWFDEALAAMIRARYPDHIWKQEDRQLQGLLEVGAAGHVPEQPQEDEEDTTGFGEDSHTETYSGPKYVYPNLKAIFLEPWDGVLHLLDSSSKLWLQKSIQAGIERGVDVRTRTNVNPPIHRGLEFHVPPDMFDVRPDLSPPGNQDFDPYLGQWVDKCCGNGGGDCEECYLPFPRELWAEAYRAPAQNSSSEGVGHGEEECEYDERTQKFKRRFPDTARQELRS